MLCILYRLSCHFVSDKSLESRKIYRFPVLQIVSNCTKHMLLSDFKLLINWYLLSTKVLLSTPVNTEYDLKVLLYAAALYTQELFRKATDPSSLSAEKDQTLIEELVEYMKQKETNFFPCFNNAVDLFKTAICPIAKGEISAAAKEM